SVQIDPFRRYGRDVRGLAEASKCILDIRMVLRAGRAQPVTKITIRVLIEIDNVGAAAIDREIPRAGGSSVSVSARGPTEHILRPKIFSGRIQIEVRSKSHDLVNFVLGRTLCVEVAGAHRPSELKRLRRIER